MKKRVVALPPAHPTAMMMNSGEGAPHLIHSKPYNVVVYLGIPAKVAAFRTTDRPIRPGPLPVQSVHHLDGTGVTTRNAAFHTTPTLLLRNALLGGNGPVRATSASQSLPRHLLKPLNLLITTVAMAGRSELRSIAPTTCALMK
jgi:hypothetical protein